MASAHHTVPRSERAPAGWAPSPIRVLVVDDHPAVQIGVRNLLEDHEQFAVVAAASSADAGLSLAEHERVDVAVVDHQLPGRSGLWLCRRLKRLPAPPRVVIYSAYCDGPLAATAVIAGADGLVSKEAVPQELVDAIRAVMRGATRIPMVRPALAAAMRRRLDAQEQAIFGLLLSGTDVAELPRVLGITRDALEARLADLLRRLEGVRLDVPPPRGAHPGGIGRRRSCEH